MKIDYSLNDRSMNMSKVMSLLIIVYGAIAYMLCSSFNINSLLSNGTDTAFELSAALLVIYCILAVFCTTALIQEVISAVKHKINPIKHIPLIINVVSMLVLIINVKLTFCAFIICRIGSSAGSGDAWGVLQIGWSLISNLKSLSAYKAGAIITIVTGVLCCLSLFLLKACKSKDESPKDCNEITESASIPNRRITDKEGLQFLSISKYTVMIVASAGFFVGCFVYIFYF